MIDWKVNQLIEDLCVSVSLFLALKITDKILRAHSRKWSQTVILLNKFWNPCMTFSKYTFYSPFEDFIYDPKPQGTFSKIRENF